MRLQKSLVQFMTGLHSLSLLLHLLALAMWLGGIAFFLIVFGPAVHELKPVLGLRLLNQGRITFEALSWTAIGLLFLTGILNLVMRSDMTGWRPRTVLSDDTFSQTCAVCSDAGSSHAASFQVRTEDRRLNQ